MAEIAIKRQPVAVQPTLQDLTRSNGKAAGQRGTLIMAAVGALFLSYVFNFHGFQDSADGYFHSLDVSARAQTPGVARVYLAILPYAATALALGLLWIVMRTLLSMISSGMKSKKKKKTHAAPAVALVVAAEAQAAPQPVAAPKPPKPAAVCVKPLRLDMRDVGVAKVILPRR